MFLTEARLRSFFCCGLLALFFANFSINSMAWAEPKPEHEKNPNVVLVPKKREGKRSKEEEQKILAEQERVSLLGARILNNFGCSDEKFVSSGMQAIIKYLRESKQSEIAVLRTEGDFKKLHAHAFSGDIGIQHGGLFSNKRLSQERTPYSDAVDKVSELIRVGLYNYFERTKSKGHMTPGQLANNIASPTREAQSSILADLKKALIDLNHRSSDQNLNVACQKLVPGKNALIRYTKVDGVIKKKLLFEFVAETDAKPGEVSKPKGTFVDATVVIPQAPAKKAKEPEITVLVPPKKVEEKKQEPTHTTKTETVPENKIAKKESPKKDEPKKSEPRKEEPKKEAKVKSDRTRTLASGKARTEDGKILYSKFEKWMNARGADPKNFHNIVMGVLDTNSEFKASLLDRNPLGRLCTNFLTLPIKIQEKIISKTILIHHYAENFTSDEPETLKGKGTTSIGAWQISMNSRAFGCVFDDEPDIKLNIERNIYCVMKFYTFREQNFGNIYGEPGPSVEFKGGSTNGLPWTVFRQGYQYENGELLVHKDGKREGQPIYRKHALFERKFEPVFRAAVPECENKFKYHQSLETPVGGSPPSVVADFINAVI
jgi:hypothetical protein